MSEPLVICECSCGWNNIDSEHHGNVPMPDGTVEPPRPSNGHTFRDVRVVREEDVARGPRAGGPAMSEPLTIYKCFACGDISTHEGVCEGSNPPHGPLVRGSFRTFHEDDVRPLYLFLDTIADPGGFDPVRGGAAKLRDAFPAPEEWQRDRHTS